MLCGAVHHQSHQGTNKNGGFNMHKWWIYFEKVGLHLPELENWGFTDLSHRKIGMS